MAGTTMMRSVSMRHAVRCAYGYYVSKRRVYCARIPKMRETPRVRVLRIDAVGTNQ